MARKKRGDRNGMTKPCPFFPSGRCTYGTSCKFSHDNSSVRNETSRNNLPPRERKPPTPLNDAEIQFREWRYMVPKDALSFSDLGQELRNFFQTSQKLVEVDPGVRQEVLCKLASDGGLMRIDELISRGLRVTSPQKTSEILQNVLLPFFCTISHPGVLASAVLEKSMSTIYGYLYGPNGTRLSLLLTFLVRALTSMDQDNTIPHSKASVMKTTMVVLAKVIDLNGEAMINPELPPLIGGLEKPLKDLEAEGGDAAVFEAFGYFNRAQRRLGLGEAMPTATDLSKKTPLRPKPSFKLPSDPPGLLSVHGKRHDNDFEDIREIKILPTTSEIESLRPEYLPTNGVASHLPPLQHLVDKHFRLLREDAVGQLRDAIRAELDKPNHVGPGNRSSSAVSRYQQTARTNIYTNVKVQNFYFSRKNGFVIQICFQQLPRLKNLSCKERENWWVSSKRLQPDALVCMLDSQKKIVFCSVIGADLPRDDTNQRRNHDKGADLFSQKDYAYIEVKLCQLTAEGIDTVVNVFASRTRRPQEMQIIEFPGVLLPSFWPTLQSLQSLQSTTNLPFAEFLAPTDATSEGLMDMAPPLYAMKRGFRFNLKSIMKDSTDLYLNPTEPFDVRKLQDGSSLDDAQAIALTQAFTRRLALIQGPPGTGKSYTGVSMIKVLLDNKENAKIGPIICVCYTNHALDQLLEHLVQAGIKQVIRIGSRSKSELLQPLNLRLVSKDMPRTKTEGQVLFGLHRELEDDQEQAEGILAEIRADSWTIIRDFLKQHYPHHHDQLFGGRDEGGFTIVNHAKEHTIQNWLSGSGAFRGDTDSSANRSLKELFTAPVSSMSTTERRRLYANWTDRIRGRARLRLLGVLESFEGTKTAMHRIHQEADLRCLQEANVIGLTTTGLARNVDLLRRVQSHVMLCEEAGEVLEAHVLTALLPSLEHAILIGDHLQLRPQVQNYKLSSESHEGKKYSLDVSLFERLIAPETEGLQVPYTTLETQRRMHPSISQLIRDTLYPKLKDSEEPEKYPEVVGMRKRLFWMDHQHAEDKSASQDSVSTSHTNEFEVEMVAALVSHLVRQGVYKSSDIAVLTPYLGQLHKLRQRLRRSFEIVLNDRDQDNLEEAELGSHEETTGKEIAQTTLLQTLRAATVDNFQGEEAKVVVISLVRSNPQGKCGFLKTHNRINVLLSRAQHGMYLIGDSRTYTSIPMWDKVIAILKGDGNFGTSLDLKCPRHPESPISASVPEDFQRFSPEGGCELMCKDRLSCGHPCINKCHSDLLHKAVKCLEPCPRPLNGCDHPCPLPCGDKCDPLCKVPLTDSKRVLPCGHGKLTLPCYQAQDSSGVRCDVKVQRTVPHCGHSVAVRCYQNVEDDKFRCDARCEAALPCGHTCNRACHKCFPKDNANQSEPDHGGCAQVCNRPYATCQHSCSEPCHTNHPCQPCEAPCEVECSHSKCNKRCSEPCAPCASDNCTSSCSHGSCTMPCAAPCNWLPCSRRCEKKLDCGHRCPSVCGEECPPSKYCQTCANDEIKNRQVDFILMELYHEIDLNEDPCIFPPCMHFLTVSSMDGQMDFQKYYAVSEDGNVEGIARISDPFSVDEVKVCATCRGSLRKLSRYGRIVRRALIDEASKKFVQWSSQEYIKLAKRLDEAQKQLQGPEQATQSRKPANAQNPLPENLDLTGTRQSIFNTISRLANTAQYKTIVKLTKEIDFFVQQAKASEQPYSKVCDMVENARRRHGITGDFQQDGTIIQMKGYVLAKSLQLRCDLIWLSHLFNGMRDPLLEGFARGNIKVDLTSSIEDCNHLIGHARASKRPRQMVEGLLYKAHFIALQRPFASSSSSPSDESSASQSTITATAQSALNLAQAICTAHPSQTKDLGQELEHVQSILLRSSTFYMPVSTEERLAVLSAMASEFRGSGHWYYCRNNHPFTIGECGMPMERARCPECGEGVGGRRHRAVEGVRRAEDLEGLMGGLRV